MTAPLDQAMEEEIKNCVKKRLLSTIKMTVFFIVKLLLVIL